MTARVIPFPGMVASMVPETAAEAEARTPVKSTPCPVCAYPIDSNDCYDLYDCARCGVIQHGACYWGRVAALEEWVAYIRRVMETEDQFSPDVVCAACRQLEGLGKEGAR